ncbi:MAG: GatB/YqeY domain-containing protein [Candidatus Paceibacterota bacterium]
MELESKIKEDLKEAMKKGDNATRDVLRMLTSDIKNETMKVRKELDDKEVLGVVRKNIKSRKDSIEQFVKGGREDLAAQEKAELVILEKYQPVQMGEDEIRLVVKKALANLDEKDAQNFGLVMKEAMKDIEGKADGAIVSKIVKETLIG